MEKNGPDKLSLPRKTFSFDKQIYTFKSEKEISDQFQLFARGKKTNALATCLPSFFSIWIKSI